MNSSNILRDVLAALFFLGIAFLFPTLSITLLGSFVGFTVCAVIFAVINIQDEIVSNSNGNIITSDVDEIIDNDNDDSKDEISQTQPGAATSTFANSMETTNPSSEFKSSDTKLHTSSKLEDKMRVVCPEVEDETPKDFQLICPLVTKSLDVDSKFIHAEVNAEDLRIHTSSSDLLGDVPGDKTVLRHFSDVFVASSTKDEVVAGHPICTSSTNPLKSLLGDNADHTALHVLPVSSTMVASSTKNEVVTLPTYTSSTNPLQNLLGDNTDHVLHVLPASKITDEVSTENALSSNNSNANQDEVRTTISEEKSGNIEFIKGEKIEKVVSRKYPLDTVPMEFIYPCLPYF